MHGVSIAQYNIRSALCVPFWEESRVYGAIYLDNLAKTHAFTRDDLDLVTAIANLIAMRIKQEELKRRRFRCAHDADWLARAFKGMGTAPRG